jgi:hypothetical protein
MVANTSNFQWALTNWTTSRCTPDSQIWIWIFSHGVGLHHHFPLFSGDEERWSIEDPYGGRPETSSDEGFEITEWLIQTDVNHDDEMSNSTWVGVDEGVTLSPQTGEQIVWDDDFRLWLEGISCRRMVISAFTCRSPRAENETESCYGGGLIDDLSAPRRIIISCANETYSGWYNETTKIAFFAEPFMNALDPSKPAWNEACNSIDNDGVTSVLEAYLYARQHDKARKAVRIPPGQEDPWKYLYPSLYRAIDESPWLDDGGNFLPNFINLIDAGNPYMYGYDQGDAPWLARYTWLKPDTYSGYVEDINDDMEVDITDVTIAAHRYGWFYPGKWDSQSSIADINMDNWVDIQDIAAIAFMFGRI